MSVRSSYNTGTDIEKNNSETAGNISLNSARNSVIYADGNIEIVSETGIAISY